MGLGVGSWQTGVLGPQHSLVLTSLDLAFPIYKYQTVLCHRDFWPCPKCSPSALSNVVARMWLLSLVWS